jgi:hypothetical protein
MYERRYTILLAKTRTTIGRLDAIAGGRSEVPDYEKFTVAWPTTTAFERRPPTGEVHFLHPDRRVTVASRYRPTTHITGISYELAAEYRLA